MLKKVAAETQHDSLEIYRPTITAQALIRCIRMAGGLRHWLALHLLDADKTANNLTEHMRATVEAVNTGRRAAKVPSLPRFRTEAEKLAALDAAISAQHEILARLGKRLDDAGIEYHHLLR